MKRDAFIDAQNLYQARKNIGWDIDWIRFRRYLKEHHGVENAYMFLGYLTDQQSLYNKLQLAGFVIIFKPVIVDRLGRIKANIDVDLTVYAMKLMSEYDEAILVTNDGDFTVLARHLEESAKLGYILAPSKENCSKLLSKEFAGKIGYIDDLKKKIEKN